MKIRYLLLGLTILCAAGTGAIQPSVGFPGAEDLTPQTPFLVFGHVWYEGGAPCNSPIVNISSNGASLQAETRAECNHYQIILSEVSDGDLIEFNATDGAGFNATSRTVGQSDLDRGGVFEVNLTLPSAPPISEPSAILVIYGNVPYKNGTPCDSPYVVVTKLNTFKELIADNRTGESFYQLTTSSAFAEAGDVLKINASKNGTPVGDATHTVNQTEIEDGAIEVNLNEELVNAPDFTVTDISFTPPEPLIGGLTTINATILNAGAEGATYVEFYDNKSISLAGKDSIITLPGALKIRVHFHVSCGNITIYNETGVVEELEGTGKYWTKWCDGATIRIELESQNTSWFIVDRYEALLGNKRITLGRGNSTNVSAVWWNLSDQYMGWATNGTHEITVRADPSNQVIESDETNNNRTEAINVTPSLDFAVTNITFSNNAPVLGDLVRINATIRNYGVGNGTTVVAFLYDNISTGRDVFLPNETVTLNGTESKVVSASWQTGAAYGGVGNHTITVMVDPDDALVETNETNNTLHKQAFVNGTDLTVTAIEMPCGLSDDNRCYVGQNVNVTATIANIGAVDATNFTVNFLDGICSGDGDANRSCINFTEVHIGRLDSGESRNVSVIWNPAETGWHTINASIPYDVFTDNNEANNELSGFSCVEPRYDFLVESVNVTPPHGARRGESVNITTRIGNIGHTGGNVSIAFFVNSTDFAGTCGERFTRIRTIDDVYVGVGETVTVPITWGVGVAGGCHMIAAVVNPDNELEEPLEPYNATVIDYGSICFRGETGNNVKNCTLQVIPNDLDITGITIDPAELNIGDLVDVSATIRNNGDAKANSTVWFYMEQELPPKTHILQPEDVMIRVHFDYIKTSHTWGRVDVYVNDSQGQRPVYLYYKNEEGEMLKVPRIDSSMPCTRSDANWNYCDDVWTDWGYGDTFEIEASDWNYGAMQLVSTDKYQVRLGNETVTLDPGESMVYHSTWNASPPIKAGEYYRLMANVENLTRYSNETYLGGTDLAITNLSVRSAVWDGDRVWVNATIGNLGRMDATAFIVNFTEVYSPISSTHPETSTRIMECHDHLELINTTHIEGLDIGNSINISVSWNASIRDIECEGLYYGGDPCPPWIETADDYNIRVEINTLENEDKEEDDTNHIREPRVDVGESRDFNVMDLSFYANNESHNSSELVIYDDVTLNATLNITNLANQGGSVDVSFYIDDAWDEHEIGNTTVAFLVGGGTGYAEIKWKVENFGDVDITGDHNMTVVVDPENRIYEIDDDQNTTYIQPIYVMASDLLVKRLEFYPESPVRGETVSINATIANHGDANASNLILTIYDWAERYIEDADDETGVGCKQILITRDNATAMRLYLDLEIDGGRVSINDSGREITHYDGNFHGWTPWVLDNRTTIVVTTNKTHSAYARVSRVYYLTSSSIIDTSTHDLDVNETKKITVDWNPSSGGERFVAAILDPENDIIESNEFNNRLSEFIQVQTADILVSNLSLGWLNGTEIGEDEIIRDGDDVRISANLTNIGVENADSFDVRFLVDDLLITNGTVGDLERGKSMVYHRTWNATVGDHLLKVEADYVDEIDETNETNNIMAMEQYVYGAELSGNTSWVTLGLHGRILFEPDQPYDEDEVVITAIVNNSGYAPAENFSAALFFDYEPFTYYKPGKFGQKRMNKSYDDAVCIYLNIDLSSGDEIFAIYDGNDTEVKRVDGSCWVQVQGDTVSVEFLSCEYFSSYMIDFYPVYPDNLSQIQELDVNSSIKLPPIKQNVSTGDYPIILFIDPENKAPEDEDCREDNIISRTMHVKPTRDFTVTSVAGERTNLSDLDTQTITAGVSNIGLRNGTAGVSFVDYEEESRRYRYHFDTNRSPSYLPIPPDARLSGIQYDEYTHRYYNNLMIIHRPGVDAIDLHFNEITLSKQGWSTPAGAILICDENGSRRWSAQGPGFKAKNPTIFHDKYIPVSGETAYIYTNNYASFDLDRYTTETEFHREDVTLNATKTWNESKNVTPIRTAYTGDHTITVTLDGDDKISEINESNNELPSSLLHVNASRDPVIVGVNITPENPDDGDDVNITAVVANNGSKDASFTVDLWANLTRNEPDPDESLPDSNLTTNMGGDRIRYITLLNHTNVTLAPGENTTVNATWCDISLAGRTTTHHIIAIVDATDEIDEMNESNNEIVKRITPDLPDLTIGTAHVRGGTGEAVVPIIEIGGASGASDITVRFESSETEECNEGCGRMSRQDANNMQVHFEHLRVPSDGYVAVRSSFTGPSIAPSPYSGVEFYDMWGPWVDGDTVYIDCLRSQVEIDKYRWGNVSDAEQFDLPAGGSKSVEIPWEYECPRMINVTVDPDNNITEINEGNNNESKLWYADLRAERIEFFSPQDNMLSLDAEKFEIEGTITNCGDEDGIIEPVSDFNVTLEFREWHYSNGTDGDVVFNITKHVEEPLYADEERTITFEFDPSEKFEIDGKYENYSVFLIADSSGDICESSELYYPDGEDNNDTRYVDTRGNEYVRVYGESGYTGGGELVNVAQGEVNGRVVYTIGDSRYAGLTPPGETETVGYTGVIPDDADIEFARIFLYWFMYHRDPNRPDEYAFISEIADVDVTFNGHRLDMAGKYNDTPNVGADYGYGLYSYDVKDHITRGENVATVTNNAEWDMGVHAIGLLVVYKDEDEPLTKYWVNEGADIVMAANGEYDGGLPSGDCITTATFEDVERDDTENVNAALLTVMGMYKPYSPEDLFSNPGDALEFNGRSIGSKNGTGYWGYNYLGSGIALTSDEWEDVTDHLKSGDNLAEIHSFGNYMMPNNAFLRLIFPPDLNVIDLTAPSSTVVGAHHSINATIRNDGRSDAHDFNVTFHIDGKQMIRIPHLDLPAGENMTIYLYNWTPLLLMHSYNLTAAADVLSGADWTEVETENNAMTKHVPIEQGGFGNETGPRGTGGGSNPTGGEYTETITGRVMEGVKFSTFGGGGGAGMFSALEWIMKGAVWLVLVLFVCAGYRAEQRSYGRVSRGWGVW